MIESLLKNIPKNQLIDIAAKKLFVDGVQCFVLYAEDGGIKTSSFKENVVDVCKKQIEEIKRLRAILKENEISY